MYAADFDMDTATWENEEVGAYLRLLLYEWVNKGLPDDTYKLAKIARESERKFKEKWKNLSEKFHLNGNGLLVNSRMEEEREKQAKFLESQSLKGKKSAEARINRGSNRGSTGVPTEGQPSFSSSFSSSFSLKDKDLKEGENAPFKMPTKEEIQEASEPMILEFVETISIQLHKEKIFREVFAFKNKMLKAKKNPRAILHTLCRAYVKREFEETPWAFCQKIIEIESGKYNARDYGKTATTGD